MNDGQKNFYNVNYEYMYGMYGIRYKSFYENLYDFKLEYEINEDNSYIFPTIVKDGEYIKLVGNYLTIYSTESDLHFNSILLIDLIQAKLKTQAYIEDRCYFYFFTYDDIYSFSSGYSQQYIDMSRENFISSFESLIIHTNNSSPFSFIDSMDLLDLKFTYY